MLHYIPFELQQLDQWVVATGVVDPLTGKRNKVPLNPRTGAKADPTDRSTWGSFQEAQACGYPLVGFVLSKEDPYCIIDLDDPSVDSDGQPLDPELAQKYADSHARILEGFQSYSELSQSGKGLHIICKGAIPHGTRRGKVEIYSDNRYMICTGNVFRPLPIVDCQEQLLGMFHAMNAEQPVTNLVQIDGHMTDDAVFDMASRAANSQKFLLLWSGNWKPTGEWPSQSEADFALLSMLAFYTKDNEQVRRIFRWSGLVRDKSAEGNDKYLDFALRKIRAKEVPLIDFSALTLKHTQTQLALRHDESSNQSNDQVAVEAERSGPAPDSPAGTDDTSPADENGRAVTAACFQEGEQIENPPGLIGELAEYIYGAAIRPVREVSLAAALSLVAGVAGRTYNISDSGLNQYIIVIARTGSGKEGAQKGINKIIAAVRPQVPMVDNFVGPSKFASGQGLLRALDRQPCFVSVLGEIGLQLKAICDKNASPSQVMLKQVILDIYAKSDFQSVLRPSAYSDSEKDTKLVQAPNVTIFGESTAENFYDSLDASNIAEGLIPRFSIFEYLGPRPPRNPNAFGPPERALVDRFAALLATCIAAGQNRAFCPIQINEEAKGMLDEFDRQADAEMNGAIFDVNRQLWNRAHLKALKLAGLVAVGCNAHAPVVTAEYAAWAIKITTRDIKRLLKHFASGDIGQGDERLEADLRRAIDDLCAMKPATKAHYDIPEKMRELPVVPLVYLKKRLRALSAFRNHRLGANAALTLSLKSMLESGELQLVSPLQAASQFQTATPLYVKGPQW
jgi:hypothetical protein